MLNELRYQSKTWINLTTAGKQGRLALVELKSRGKSTLQPHLDEYYAEGSKDWTTRKTQPAGVVTDPSGTTSHSTIIVKLKRGNDDNGGDECDIDTIVTLPSVRNEETSKIVEAEL